MKKDNVSIGIALGIGVIAVGLTIGLGMITNSSTTNTILDVWEYTNNKTALDFNKQLDFENKRNQANDELYRGIGIILASYAIMIVAFYWGKKSSS